MATIAEQDPTKVVAGEYDDSNDDGVCQTEEIKVDKLADVIAKSAQSATYAKLRDAEILKFDEDIEGGLTLFYLKQGITNWEEVKTINQILFDLLGDALAGI